MQCRPFRSSMAACLLAGMFWLGLPGSVHASPGQVQSGKITIYYNALSGDALPVQSTRTHNLRHASSQGIVIITASHGQGADSINVPVTVSGEASTLLGHQVPLTFRHFNEHGNLSTLVVFDLSGAQTVRFDLTVTPQGAPTTHLHFVHDYEP